MELTHAQRQQRMNIRNFFLTASVAEIQNEIEIRKARKDKIGILALEEMIAECEKAGVDNFGKT